MSALSPRSTLFPYTTLFRSRTAKAVPARTRAGADRKQLFMRSCLHAVTNPSRPQNRWQRFPERLRSEEHTSELQSLRHLVCRLLLEKKKQIKKTKNQITLTK